MVAVSPLAVTFESGAGFKNAIEALAAGIRDRSVTMEMIKMFVSEGRVVNRIVC